jgi:hypothetical protein
MCWIPLTYADEFGLLPQTSLSEISFLLLLKNFDSWTWDVFEIAVLYLKTAACKTNRYRTFFWTYRLPLCKKRRPEFHFYELCYKGERRKAQ